jgi:hypothetical protein
MGDGLDSSGRGDLMRSSVAGPDFTRSAGLWACTCWPKRRRYARMGDYRSSFAGQENRVTNAYRRIHSSVSGFAV